MKRNLLAPIVTLLVFILLNYSVMVQANHVFEGEGSIENPYMLYNPDDLVTLGKLVNNGTENYSNASYILMEDIDLSVVENYTPIGVNEAYPFSGRFDGNDKVIKGLSIQYNNSSSVTKYFGLFGYNRGTIENIKEINGEISITGSATTVYTGSVVGMNLGLVSNITTYVDIEVVSYAGGITGSNSGEITRVVNHGKVYGTGNSWGAGGISGVNRGEISRSANHGIIRGLNTGGITGINYSTYDNNSIISESYNTGSIRGSESGGISGTTGGIISHVYNHGSVYGNTSSGGISGVIDENGSIDSAYNTGVITGKLAGGITGSSAGYVRNAYFLDSLGQGIAEGTGDTTQVPVENLDDADSFSDFDFDVWVIDDRHPFIQLRNNDYVNVEENAIDYAGGHGTLWSPFLISGKEELQSINLNPGSYFKLISDVSLAEGEKNLVGTSWTPLEAFYGSFDGGEFSISNLVIKSPEEQEFGDIFNLGLFSENYGEISNVRLDGNIIIHEASGSTINVGMLTAENNGNLRGIEVSGAITGRGSVIGGVVGTNNGEIYDVLNRAHIDSDQYSYSSGGIAGENLSVIKRALNVGSIKGGENIGGIVGLCYGTIDFASNHAAIKVYDGNAGGIAASTGNGVINNSFNTGLVNQISYSSVIGGIVGDGSNGTLNSVYSIGDVAGDTVGAIAGIGPESSRSVYYLDTANESGVGSGEDHMVALSHDDMTEIETYIGFDTVSIWETDKSGKYPYIKLKGLPLIYITINFDSNGGTHYDQMELLAGSLLDSDIYQPIKEGYSFEGWYSDQELKNKVDISNESMNHNITLYAKWLPLDVINRIHGDNRYRTAAAISQESYSSVDTVILVQANNFPDALAAGPLAYIMDAPILLTSTTTLSSTSKLEIERLDAKKIVIMGGYSAVSENVENTLKTEGYLVERLEGSNRYATAVATAQFIEITLGARNTLVLASGNQFADALAAGSYAAKEGLPIILTDGNRLTNTTKDYVIRSNIKNIVIVGGTSIITEALEEELKSAGITITRKSGKNRFDTSLEIAKSYFEYAEMAVVANGMEFADALAAAPYAAKLNASILLVNQTRINLPIKEYLPVSKINKIVVVGGEAAVSEAVSDELRKLIE